jgi:transposase-like protein
VVKPALCTFYPNTAAMEVDMPYSEMFKRKMIQKMTGPDPVSATALSREVDVPQSTLSKWLKTAGIKTPYGFHDNIEDKAPLRAHMNAKRPEDWSPEEKLKAVLEAAALADDQLGAFLRRKGLHETHLQQWRLRMLNGLGKPGGDKKSPRNAADLKRIRILEKELNRKDKALAETAALLVLKKKVQEIWGDEDDSTAPRNGK